MATITRLRTTYRRSLYVNGALNNSSTVPSLRDYTSDITTKSSVPNYKYKLRHGDDATSTFVAYKEYGASVNGTDNTCYWEYASNDTRKAYLSGCVPGTHPAPTINVSASAQDDSKARLRLFDQIREQRNTFSGGTFVGEFGETVRMLRKPLKALFEGVHNYRNLIALRAKGFKAVKGRIKALNKMISHTWLEVQYGWKPLFNDIGDIADILDEKLDFVEDKQISLKGTSNREVQRFLTITGGTTYGDVFKGIDTDLCIDKVLVIYRCGFKWGSDADKIRPGLVSLQERIGFTPADFVPTVWNLIPFSFLVDYFTNVGGILSASFTNTQNVTWCNRTIYLKATRLRSSLLDQAATVAYVKGLGGKSVVVSGASLGSFVAFRSQVDRRSVGLDVPGLTFTLPPADSLKWLNMAALASSFTTLSTSLRK